MEVGHAVATQGMSREQANEIAIKMLGNYEHMAPDAPMGAQYQECYDVARGLPTQKHYDLFRKVKDDVAALGVEFPY
jgi:methylamine--corrinoid protein Co-methyltransferase